MNTASSSMATAQHQAIKHASCPSPQAATGGLRRPEAKASPWLLGLRRGTNLLCLPGGKGKLGQKGWACLYFPFSLVKQCKEVPFLKPSSLATFGQCPKEMGFFLWMASLMIIVSFQKSGWDRQCHCAKFSNTWESAQANFQQYISGLI